MRSERLPDAELEVLAQVERRSGATARQVREGMDRWRPLSHSSVMTLLGRLEERGLVRRSTIDGSREILFHATTTREEAVEPILGRIVQRVFDGDPVAIMASLFGGRRPTEKEVERLGELLEELKRETEDDAPPSREEP